MKIEKKITNLIVSDESILSDALSKINANKRGIVYAVNEKNLLIGSLSDGDVRRWMLSSEIIDLSLPISELINQPCFSLNVNNQGIESHFNERIQSIPLLDDNGRLVAVAEHGNREVVIDGRIISEDQPAYIIAEIGINHQGDIELAKNLVNLAAESNVDCVKFQMRNLSKLYKNKGDASDASADLGAQYTLDLLTKFQLTDDELFEVFDYAKEKGVTPLCTPWDLNSLQKLEDYGMHAYKVASADFTNYELLEALVKTRKPIICSTGMSTESEILKSVNFLKQRCAQFILLHCNSTYPAPYKDVNLRYLKKIADKSGVIVGYSGHERGWWVPIASIALGAKVIEKHFTIDRKLEGNDHKVSLLPKELTNMVRQIRDVEESLGSDDPRELSQGEMINREVLSKSLIMNQDLMTGSVITRDMIEIKSPGQGLQPNRIEEIVGKIATRDLKIDDLLFESDITGVFEKELNYQFSRPYGIPVRYHDFNALSEGISLDFVEFHLSYKDIEVNISDHVEKNQKINFAVHSPDLFSGDHIMDLAEYNNEHRERSIEELKKVISVARELKEYFPKTVKPVIVVNAGGWDTQGFLGGEDKNRKYELIMDALNQVDSKGVELAIQTMPPFPWHFGGQSYCSLFLSADEIVDFCKRSGHKICLDVSHSMMACNYFGWDIYEFVEKVSPYVVHMHVVDAKGSDGEGVQIGKGDVDFDILGKILKEHMPTIQFLPEVWQGHVNRGEGFWSALKFLEFRL